MPDGVVLFELGEIKHVVREFCCELNTRVQHEAAGAHAMCVKDTAPLGPDIIHSVNNPIPRLTGAIHVYGGDFFAMERSEWDPETLEERPYDVEKALAHFEAANATLPGPDQARS